MCTREEIGWPTRAMTDEVCGHERQPCSASHRRDADVAGRAASGLCRVRSGARTTRLLVPRHARCTSPDPKRGARSVAHAWGVRLIGIDRPGVGSSTPHLYDRILDWADDFAVVADRLGVEESGLIGMSGGGPYALACRAALPDRITAAAGAGRRGADEGSRRPRRRRRRAHRVLRPGPDAPAHAARLGFAGFVWTLWPFVSQALRSSCVLARKGDRRSSPGPT